MTPENISAEPFHIWKCPMATGEQLVHEVADPMSYKGSSPRLQVITRGSIRLYLEGMDTQGQVSIEQDFGPGFCGLRPGKEWVGSMVVTMTALEPSLYLCVRPLLNDSDIYLEEVTLGGDVRVPAGSLVIPLGDCFINGVPLTKEAFLLNQLEDAPLTGPTGTKVLVFTLQPKE